MVDAGRVGEPPAGRLQVEAELGDHGEGTAAEVGDDPAVGQLGQVRQVGQLPEDHPQRLAEVLAGHRPDAGGEGAHACASGRDGDGCAEMVAEPTTRVPS